MYAVIIVKCVIYAASLSTSQHIEFVFRIGWHRASTS